MIATGTQYSVPAAPKTGGGNVRPPGVYALGALLVANRALDCGQCAEQADQKDSTHRELGRE